MADTGIAVRYRFAGREYDAESGLHYMRARYYDPALGRWISEDPIGIAGGRMGTRMREMIRSYGLSTFMAAGACGQAWCDRWCGLPKPSQGAGVS